MNLSQAIAHRFHISLQYPAHDDEQWYNVPCPLHNDESPSAGINFAWKKFNCKAGCGNFGFRELAEKLLIEWERGDTIEDLEIDFLNNLIEETTTIKPKKLRVQAKEYAEFLISRQLKPETIEEFGGYYVSDITHPDYGHLVIPYGKGKFNKRRILGQTKDTKFRLGKGEEKDIFARDLNKWDTVILCEGLSDFITLWQVGIKNVVSTFGAGVSEKQMYMLRGKTVFILFDKDFAGYKGALEAYKFLSKLDAIPIILEIPQEFGDKDEKIDINSAYCHSGDVFIQWVKESVKKYNVFDTDYMTDRFLMNKSNVSFVTTGIPSLTFASGMHAIAGMPGVGKSSLISWLIKYFVRALNQRVLALSYELSKEQMYARLASIDDEHNWSEIERDQTIISENTSDMLVDLSQRLRIERNWGINEIKAASKNFDIIIVDYIQRMSFDGTDDRVGIKANARELSDLTRDGKIVLLISSIPRSMYDKTGVNIFKETGDIEYIIQSAYLISKMTEEVSLMACIKNTRQPKKDFYIQIDYGHQIVSETIKPELRSMIQ